MMVKKNRTKSPSEKTEATPPQVAIVMGSDSDWNVMCEASKALTEMGIPHLCKILSAHRTPLEMSEFAINAHKSGISVIIAGAGGAAHLPGMVAAHSPLPVIGVPVPIGHLEGQDALLSIVQMPKGVPVATVAIGNAYNAGLLAAQILAFGGAQKDEQLGRKIELYKEHLRSTVKAKKLPSET